MDPKVAEQELKVLHDISQIIGEALNLNHALDLVLGIVSAYLSMNRATITLKDESAGFLRIVASHGLTAAEKRRGAYRFDEGITGLIFRTASPFVVPDISKEPLFLNKTRSREIDKGRIAFIGVPIVIRGNPVGVLSVDRLFDEEISFREDIRFLTILAALVGQLVSLNDQVQAREENWKRSHRSLKTELSAKRRSFFAMATSPAMAEVHQLIKKVAPTRATVLLIGEPGTGKTLAARIIHELSDRSSSPFIKVNSGALSDHLLEAELFGYDRGAVPGATEPKTGLLEQAHGGTLFLNEIATLSLTLQAKLLRFIQDREFELLGSTRTRTADVRIVVATTEDLESAVKESRFREDLYYRLDVFPIHMPALRERSEDIWALVSFFSEKARREYGRELVFTPEAMAALIAHGWPGNIRELENLIERLAIVGEEETIDAGFLYPYLAGILSFSAAAPDIEPVASPGAAEPVASPPPRPRGPIERRESLKELEKRTVIAALERNDWVQSRAARELGLTLRQIGYRIRKFGLEHVVSERRATRTERGANGQDQSEFPREYFA